MQIEFIGYDWDIEVTYYERGVQKKLSGHPDTWHEGESPYVEFIAKAKTGMGAEIEIDQNFPILYGLLSEKVIDKLEEEQVC